MRRIFYIFSFCIIISNAFSQHAFDIGEGSKSESPVTTFTTTCDPGNGGCSYFSITVTTTLDSCNDATCTGTATANVSGATGPLTYLWTPTNQTTPTATGLCPNSYLIEITDGSGNVCFCSESVTAPTAIGASTSSTPATCNGVCDGTASVSSISGGVPPYTYLWAPSGNTNQTATGLCGGITHTVTITDSYGCSLIRTRFVSQPSAITYTASSTNESCFGPPCDGTATISSVSGGTSPYTFSWNPGGATTSAVANLCTGNYTCTIIDANGCTSNYTTTITEPPQLTATLTASNLQCNGVPTGSVTASVSGGVPGYTYSWAPGGCTTSACTGLGAGTYTLTLTDANGCVLTRTVVITQPTALSSAPTGTNVNCFGFCTGTAAANASGGTSPYTYNWATIGSTTSAVSGLCAGNYTVTVSDNNGCVTSATIAITQPPQLTVTPTKTDVVCPGLCNGTASAGVSGGTAPYTYSWSTGETTSSISNLCAPPLHPTGIYTVLVTDANGCTGTGTVTINMPSPLLTGASVVNNVSCFGACNGSVTASPSGGTPPYTYQWLPGGSTSLSVTGLCAGTYTFDLQDANGCPVSTVLTITQPPTFSVSISSATPNPLNCNGDCNGTAVSSVTGGTPTYTYSWSTVPVQTTPSITGLCAGTYSLNVMDANGCTTNTSVTFVQPTTLSVSITSSNPTCNGASNGSACASPGGGTPGYTFNWLPGNQTTACIAGQPAGIYTVTVTDSKGCSNTQTVTLTAPATLNANATSTNVLCAGQCNGTGTASPTGGTAPFTYLWSNGQTTSTATGLCSGTYSVTVTDANNCTDIDIITITQPSALVSSISSTTSSCTLCTGTATVTTTGGTSPYTFLWTPSGQTTSAAVGLCIGNYTVNITDANGCTNTLTTSISPVVNITVTVSGSNVSCAGACDGVANANVTGGTSPYTYNWSTVPIQNNAVATGLCAGTYSVTVTDFSGCFSTSTVSFSNPPVLTTTLSSTSASCGACNGTATASPSGGTGTYTYSWSVFPVQTTATATGLCSGNYTITIADANNCTTTGTVSVGNIPALTNSPSVTLATCGASDGAICSGISGGTPPYTYQWLPGGFTTPCITGLTAGIDTLIVSDAGGCVDTFAIGVGNISGPTVTITSTVNPTCNGDCDGLIGISVSGTSPFTYLWTPSGQTTTIATGLCAGNYIVQVADAVPCTTFASVPLTNPPQMSANPSFNNVSCNGGNDGNICLSPSGGNAPYTYQWFPGGATTSCISNLTAGTYTVVLSDALGCDDTLLIPITEPPVLTVSVTSTNISCFGSNNGSATATASGGTTLYTYSWSTTPPTPLPSVVNLGPGTYTVTVTDANGCTATASTTITQPAALTTTLSSTNVLCNGNCDGTATLVASGGTLAYTYSWNTTPGQTTSTATGLCTGSYVGMVTDANGCASSQSVTITQPTVLSAIVSTTSVTCNGGCDGTASVSASGGTGLYTYLWSSGGTSSSVTGLCAGSYTLTVTDSNGCAINVLFTVNQPMPIQANMGVTSPKCFGGCDGTATSSPVGGVGPYTFSWNTIPVQTTATATGLCSGSYTLTLSDANGCFINQPITIGAPPPLTQASGVAGATCNLCNGSISVVASGGTVPYTFVWNTTPVQTTATITGLCAGVYIDTVFDANGCISVDTIGVSNTTGPLITLSSTSVTCNGLCNGTATVANVSGNGPPFTYLWNFQSQTTQTATGLCAGQSPFFVTVTDINGCKTVDFINVTEPAAIAANATVTNATCFGQCDGSIVTAATGGTGALTYFWNGTSGTATTASITNQCAGNYTLTITDANNCVLTVTFTIGQNVILTSSVISSNASCNTSCDGSAAVTAGGGMAPYTYLWSPSNQTTSAATGLCAGTHTVLITDANGCQRIDSAVITQPAPLVSNISGTNPLCNGDCNGSVSASPSGGTAPYTYLWLPGGCTTSSCSNLCAGTYTLVLTDANNCVSTTTVSISDPAVLSSTDIVTHSTCTYTCDGAIDLTPSGGTGAYTYNWSTSPPQFTQDVTNLCPGIYSVTITDVNGCSFTDSITVGVITMVTSVAGNDTSFCAGGTAILTSSSINATSVTWYQLPAWTNVGTTSVINVSPPVGVTSYALIAMNGICSDTDTVMVTVNAFPILSVNNDTTICQGDSITLCASGAGVYVWHSLPAWTPIATGNCITVSPAVGTTCFGVTGYNGVCSDSDSVCVTVVTSPVALAGNDTAFCAGGSVILCSNSLNAVSVAWYSVPAWTLIDTASCITVTPPAGMNDFGLIATNGICNDTDTVSVNVYSLPPVDAGTNVSILSTSSTVLNGSGGGSYNWFPATGLSCTTCANPIANPSVSTTYTLLVTDANGCIATDTVRVSVVLEVIPNDGLSPNGDGINDVWTIPGIEQFPDAVVEIYNRWGELLFRSVGYKQKWDCKYKGSDLPVGTYYYVINLNNPLFKDPITGPLTILR